MTTSTINVKISDLILWDENSRFPDKYYNSNEKEMINYFLNTPKFELIQFIKEVVKDFDLPQLEKLVVWNNENSLIVIEGNRRLTAYKLLCNPKLAENTKIYNTILELKQNVKINTNYELECVLSTNEIDCLRYVDRKHIRKNNEVGWEDGERANYNVRRGNKSQSNLVKKGIIERVSNIDIPDELKDRILGKGYVTNFFRVLTTTPAKKKYGYKINEKNELEISNNEFEKELKVIIYSLLKKEDFDGNILDSRTLNKSEEIEGFLQSIKPKDTKRVDESIKANTVKDIFDRENINLPNSSKKSIPKTPRTKKLFDKLFSGDLSLVKGDTNDIYRDILDLFKYYITNKSLLSVNFPSLIRMSLRLLVESATNESQKISQYVILNYEEAKKGLSKDQKTTLSNNSINSAQSLIQLLQSGAHNYSNTANFEQTSAMSIIIGEMLKITHSKG